MSWPRLIRKRFIRIMRRFSARNQLVTLHEINITPLLDLAFVLLIIFMITSPLFEGSIDLHLPQGGDTRSVASAKDFLVAEVDKSGHYFLAGRSVPNLNALEKGLGAARHANSNLVVHVRGDARGPYELVISIISAAQHQGISRFKLATEPEPHRQ